MCVVDSKLATYQLILTVSSSWLTVPCSPVFCFVRDEIEIRHLSPLFAARRLSCVELVRHRAHRPLTRALPTAKMSSFAVSSARVVRTCVAGSGNKGRGVTSRVASGTPIHRRVGTPKGNVSLHVGCELNALQRRRRGSVSRNAIVNAGESSGWEDASTCVVRGEESGEAGGTVDSCCESGFTEVGACLTQEESSKNPTASSVETRDLQKEVSSRRTFAIISHPDAGKTTLTEKLLYYGGAINEAGAVRSRRGAKAATSDWMEMEQQRGISISSTALSFQYAGFTLNLLDTPGHADFSEDTYRTVTAADNAVMLIDSAKGLEPQTRKLFEVCRLNGLPIFTFCNKVRDARFPNPTTHCFTSNAGDCSFIHRDTQDVNRFSFPPQDGPAVPRAARVVGPNRT